MQKSGTSFAPRHIGFADQLKLAHEQQRQSRQETVIQNWVKSKQEQSHLISSH